MRGILSLNTRGRRGHDAEAEGESSGGCSQDVTGGICSKSPCYTGVLPSCSDKGQDTEMFVLLFLYSLPKPLSWLLLSTCQPWLSAALAALLPLPSSAGNRALFIYQVTVGRGISGQPELPRAVSSG